MENRWTLHVENLGRIERADVTVAPLTMFVGDNNSGKSYLMALLYALLSMRFDEGFDLCKESPAYQYCMEWIHAGLEIAKKNPASSGVLHLTEDVLKKFAILLNAVLEKNRGKISRFAFNSDVEIGKISTTLSPSLCKDFRISFASDVKGELSYFYSIESPHDNQFQPFQVRDSGTAAGVELVSEGLLIFILEYLIKWDFGYSSKDIIFLPTSRTGFLLSYSALISDAFSRSYDALGTSPNAGQLGQLTRPCSDFLKNLPLYPRDHAFDAYDSIIHFIEKNIIHGKIVRVGPGPLFSLAYQPDSQDLNIPMHLSSGVVTELTPLLLMLKYRPMSTLFIEEPEIELHPELQLSMARVLIRICNQHTPVFVTTHSDTIIQHLNDMIKLNGLPEKKRVELMERFSYEASDLIAPEDVAIYQFDNQPNSKSTLQRLSANEYGFEVPTFNDTLMKILQESRAFEWDAEDDA